MENSQLDTNTIQNNQISNKSRSPLVAYFSMEISIKDEMKTYCGGLGVLAGDILKSASDLGSNMVGVTLLYKNGWFKQVLDKTQGQIVEPDSWDWEKYLTNTGKTFEIPISGETAKVEIWQYSLVGVSGQKVEIYFLNTDLEENSELVRKLSSAIYPPDRNVWFRQETLLGIGGLKALEVLGLEVGVYHLNESHAMTLALALHKKYNGDVDKVRSSLCFTTHTPLATAHQTMTREMLTKYVDQEYLDMLEPALWENNQGQEQINFTKVCTWYAKYSNAVAKRHQKTMDEMYPDMPVDYITNGIHHLTWLSPYLQQLFTQYIPNWQTHPSYLRLIAKIPDQEIYQAHQKAKQDLVEIINTQTETPFSKDIFTIGFARRAVPYKRANLLLSQIDRLREIAKKFGGIQIVFAGKAYPGDESSNQVIKEILNLVPDQVVNVVYLANYHLDIAAKLVAGVDIWLNNPIPPLEASGTSGMKAAANGVPHFSILDGWWPEGHIEGVTGWSIGEDLCEGDQCSLIEIEDLYSKLETEILPSFKDIESWTKIMKSCISINGSFFHTHRVLEEYFARGYFGNMYANHSYSLLTATSAI